MRAVSADGEDQALRADPGDQVHRAGKRTILRLKLKGGKKKRQRQTRRIKRSIERGRGGRARIAVDLSDETGNSVTEKRVARLKLKKKG